MPRKALCFLAAALSASAVRVDDDAESVQEAVESGSDALAGLLEGGSADFELVARAAPPGPGKPVSALEVTLGRKENAAQKAAERKLQRAESGKSMSSASAVVLQDKAAHALELAKKAEAESKYAEAAKGKAEEEASKHEAAEKKASESKNGDLAAAEASARRKAEEEAAAAKDTKRRADVQLDKEAGEATLAAAEARRKAAQSAAFKKAEDAAVIAQKAEDLAACKKTKEREARERAEREAASASAFHAAHRRDEAEAAELRHKQAELAADVAKKATDRAEEHATKMEHNRKTAEENALNAGKEDYEAEKKSIANMSDAALDSAKGAAAPCADEGGVCYCVGVAVFGQKFDTLEHTLASPVKIKNADGNIGCNSKAFHNLEVNSTSSKQCWCVGVLAVEHVEQMAYKAKLRAKDALKKADELDDQMRKQQALMEEEIEREEHEAEAVIEKVQNEIKKVERKVDIAGRRAVDVAKQVDNN
eukprot:TRINITY_DN92578_c0_g1_i1.p1 TRINITY_DN92578_c0_g1~~TRINITY_DN92578_c0_g1_i1.p1  ORF type:complete len:480 (+),score=218.39 TRINITY_DN92578_c0_g1_i1:122-1561(+)